MSHEFDPSFSHTYDVAIEFTRDYRGEAGEAYTRIELKESGNVLVAAETRKSNMVNFSTAAGDGSFDGFAKPAVGIYCNSAGPPGGTHAIFSSIEYFSE